MQIKTMAFSSLFLITSLILCHGGEITLPLDKVPEVPRQAIQQKAGSDKVLKVEKSDDGGTVTYEALVKKNDGKKVEYVITPDGKLDSTEEKIDQAELPGNVATTVTSAVADGKMGSVHRVTKDGTVTFEVDYKPAKGDAMELVVSAEGKVLKKSVDND